MDFVVWANMVFTLSNSCCASKAHFFPLKCFPPVYPIMDTDFVNYDSFSFFSLFLEYSSDAITEMNDFLFLKCNH